VGIFELPVREIGASKVAEVAELLCAPENQSGPPSTLDSETSARFSAICSHDGQRTNVDGSLHRIPQERRARIGTLAAEWQEAAIKRGTKLLNLYAKVEKIEPKPGVYLVSIRFVNAGDTPLSFSTPDMWSGRMEDGKLGVGSYGAGTNWSFTLSGVPLVNSEEFPDGTVVLPTRSSKNLTFKVAPEKIAKKGTFDFRGICFTLVTYVLDGKTLANRVDFKMQSTSITIDRDYPSTPQEWKDFETRKAKEVSALPSGAMVAESGYYRLSAIGGTRGSFLTKLEAGKTAPKFDYAKWDQWQWEADLALATICKPGEACARDGRWVLRTMQWTPAADDKTHTQYERRFRAGESLPTFEVSNEAASKLYWEWLGA
jgi:hypothetical protein